MSGRRSCSPCPIPEAVWLGVLHSHEAWDGSGYPQGLAGEAVSLAARIVAAADAYEVLTTGRPCKPPRSQADALREIPQGFGSRFDPRVVAALQRAGGAVRTAGVPVTPRPGPRGEA